MKAIKAIFWWLLGFVIVPYLCMVTPLGSRKWKYLDHIYGNPIDPLGGDLAYQAKVTFLRRFRWSQLRNPINAYLRSLGPYGIVESVSHTKHTTYATIGGEDYYFTQYPIFGWYIWSGYKLLNDPRINSILRVDRHFENMMIIWPIKNKHTGDLHV